MMWSLSAYRSVFIAVGLIGVILCLVPAAVMLVPAPDVERFSELYVLGPGHMAEDYPFNVSEGNSYSVILGVGNHMAGSMCYGVYVKFRNSSEPLANSTTSSSLPALYDYRVFLRDGQVWEGNLTFSFSGIVFNGNSSSVGIIRVNNAEFGLDKTAIWDNESSGYYYQLFVELWEYDQTGNGLSYQGRFASLWLNMTSNA
jgi:hypothetical protein